MSRAKKKELKKKTRKEIAAVAAAAAMCCISKCVNYGADRGSTLHPVPCTLPDESTEWQKNTEQQEFALAVSVPVASAQCRVTFSGCKCQQQGNTTNYANLPATSCRPHASQSIPIKVKPQPASSERTMPISRQFGMHLLQHWRVATTNYPFET